MVLLHTSGGGIGIMMYAPDSTDVSLSFKLEFPYLNNKTEYEASVVGLIPTYKWELESYVSRRFHVHH